MPLWADCRQNDHSRAQVRADRRHTALADRIIWAYEHGITQAGWTSFFMLQAIAMVGMRTAVIGTRVLLARRDNPSMKPEAA